MPSKRKAKAPPFKSGIVAIIGRPNAGKSTLLNLLIDYRLSAISSKAQTTRHKILGILTGDGYQVSFLDTPGVPYKTHDVLERRLVGRALEALDSADLVVLMVEAKPPADIEERLIQDLERAKKPAILAINKIDLRAKEALLPIIEQYGRRHPFLDIVPISARKKDGIDRLLERIVAHLPEGEAHYPADDVTDRPERFLVGEAVRERVFESFGEEIPYAVAVEVEAFDEKSEEFGGKDYIKAVLYVERPSQRAIVIGHGGAKLKELGTAARERIEELLERPVYLDLWVEVRPKWRKDKEFLKRIEY